MLSEIKSALNGHPWGSCIHYFNEIDSTNTYAKALAIQGAPEGTVVIADAQTAGRGRLGRSFVSAKNMGIYLSVILRPNCKPAECMHLTCAAGVAACKAIDNACGTLPKIKWTNDLVLGKRKLGGILTELSIDRNTGNIDWVIIGIGINCCQQEADFPPEISQIACSLGIATEDRVQIAVHLIDELYRIGQKLLIEQAEIMDHFRSMCITTGQKICLLRADTVRYGTALDICNDGSLIVAFEDGSIEAVASGEVSIRGMYGYL